ncbi:Bcthp3 [Botrytis cinerea B05.10]|uniref:Bcthp3 n=3 Tax=Botryotinia fuckeliana TaxID=40559 RepID=A0A384JZ90_BOTFB|nr:Bcthp3 [Botrytis cinerea B05.10]ATZ55684.1 Bcthp3 [Botrytis cinerea B05.10]CCD52030.1 similar to SAC3/GANP domain-containing protein [Botrytis cinerea T4]
MYNTMASPWNSNIPPPPGTAGSYGYQQVAPIVAPAYHPVQVRQSFNQAPPIMYNPAVIPQQSTPQSIPPPVQKKRDWPQSVRNYVQRSFDVAHAIAGIERPDMENMLKKTITEASDTDTLFSRDWDNYPLPQQLIQSERSKAAAAWQQESLNFQLATTGLANSAKKRKSIEGNSDENLAAMPPWRANNRTGNDDRANLTPSKQRFDKRQQPFQDDLSHKGTSKFQKNLEKRQKRFDGGYKSTYKSKTPTPEPMMGPLIGTNTTLEKEYFRLTTAPVASQVRPEYILRETLDLLKKKWKKEGNYSYICDQFKSMRQDLTVQRIKNEFTVTVYEIHARIALEKGDLGEYNQCQTQLRALYAQKIGGNPVEFKAYRILYFIHTANRTALNDVIADLTKVEKESEAVIHALSVRSALALGNYHKFFRLYLDTPNMGAYLMDMFVARERLAALSKICRTYKPEVKLRFVTEELGFESDGDAAQFICDHNGQALLVEKDGDLRFLSGQAGQIFETAKAEAFRAIDIKGQI